MECNLMFLFSFFEMFLDVCGIYIWAWRSKGWSPKNSIVDTFHWFPHMNFFLQFSKSSKKIDYMVTSCQYSLSNNLFSSLSFSSMGIFLPFVYSPFLTGFLESLPLTLVEFFSTTSMLF